MRSRCAVTPERRTSIQAQRGRRSPSCASPTLPGLTNRQPPRAAHQRRVGVAVDDAVGLAELGHQAGEVARAGVGVDGVARIVDATVQQHDGRVADGQLDHHRKLGEVGEVRGAELVEGPGARSHRVGLRVVEVGIGPPRHLEVGIAHHTGPAAGAELVDAGLGGVAAHHQVAGAGAVLDAGGVDGVEHRAQGALVAVDVAEHGEPLRHRRRSPASTRASRETPRRPSGATRR